MLPYLLLVFTDPALSKKLVMSTGDLNERKMLSKEVIELEKTLNFRVEKLLPMHLASCKEVRRDYLYLSPCYNSCRRPVVASDLTKIFTFSHNERDWLKLKGNS